MVEGQRALRRDEGRAFDELVDPAITRRRLARRPRRNVAADGRLLVALRVVTEREAMRTQGGLDLRPTHAGLEGCRSRHRVDLSHRRHSAQIHGNHASKGRGVRPGPSLADHISRHAADHTRPAAEGDHREVTCTAYPKELCHVGHVAREGDRIGRMRCVAIAQPAQVDVTLPRRVIDPSGPIGRNVLGAERFGERGEVLRCEPRRRQRDVLERDRQVGLGAAGDAEGALEVGPRVVGHGGREDRVAPPMPHRPRDGLGQEVAHVKQCYP